MKKILYTMAFAALSLTACQNDNDSFGNMAENEVKITSGIDTRASGTTWHIGDAIGVYMLKNEDQSVLSNNVKYKNTSADGAMATFEVSNIDERLYYPKDAAVDLLAYYPYQNNLKDYIYKIDVSDQTNLPAIDLMTSNKKEVRRTTDKQNMMFEHVLSNIKLTLKAGDGLTDQDIEKVKVSVKGVSVKADYNLLNKELKVQPTNGDIDVLQSKGIAEAILLPQEDVSGVRFIFDIPYLDTFDVTVPSGTSRFSQGMRYCYTITITPTNVVISSQSIKPWTDGNGEGENSETDQIVEYAKILPGKFLMNYFCYFKDDKEHYVTLTKGFKISKYEITNAQYAIFLNEMQVPPPPSTEYKVYYDVKDFGNKLLFYIKDGFTPYFNDNTQRWETKHDKRPMSMVTWFGAKAFADWASGALPTDAQWEYACRAGTPGEYSFVYPSEYLYKFCVYKDNKEGDFPSNVDTKLPNGWGLRDMHGNVAEWCNDWYEKHDSEAGVTDPKGPDTGTKRVVRGGSWYEGTYECTSSYRTQYGPSEYYNCIGFRIVVN